MRTEVVWLNPCCAQRPKDVALHATRPPVAPTLLKGSIVTNERRQVLLSRPTFAELAAALGRADAHDVFNEDGDIEIGPLVFHADGGVLQSERLAVAIDEAAERPASGSIYEDGEVAIHSRRRHDGVHLIETRPNRDPSVFVVPKPALHIVAADLVDSIGKPPE